jgi:FkbM family methyltransferase
MPCHSFRGLGLCPVLWQLEFRANKNPDAAWKDFSSFYLTQLRVAEEFSSKSIICAILDIAYSFYHNDHQVPRGDPRSLKLQAKQYHREPHNFYSFVHACGTETTYAHHGLRWLPKSVKDYIWERDIIDAGAFTGDSLAVLDAYTNQTVVSYEIIPGTADQARATASHFSPRKHLVITAGLSNTIGNISVSAKGHARSGMHASGGAIVPVTTIDSEAKRLNLRVGFMKADVEGVEPNIILGALETIHRDRPVIAMSIYHNVEFLDLPSMLVNLGYKVGFVYGKFTRHLHWEMLCVAIPDFLSFNQSPGEFGKCGEFL